MEASAAVPGLSEPPLASTSSSCLHAHPASQRASAALSPHDTPLDEDQSMTDDMRIAISALGLMRKGSLGSSTAPPSHSHPPPPPREHVDHHYPSRNDSSQHRSDPSRSASTASTSTVSETWGTAATSETGASSPLTTGSVAAAESDAGDYVGDRGVENDDSGEQDPRFMARVSQLPLVSGGIEWYERSKANSRVVKYGAGLVESSFSAVSRPIANNLQLGPLDEFACRQLDRIGAPGGPSSPGRKSPRAEPEELLRGRSSEPSPLYPSARSEADDEQQQNRATYPQQPSSLRPGAAGQVATVGGQRSRWQTVLVEAGGLGAAVSEESLKSLRYCLQWLLYATAHLDHQISVLRDFILSLRAHNRTHPSGPSGSAQSSDALVAASASAHLSQIKHDVVETIRKVVEVVSKYAGAALPEQAKRYVKQSILGLPVKWASAIEGKGRGRSGSATSTSTVGRGRRDESEGGTPRCERMDDSYFPGGSSSAPSSKPAQGQHDGREDDEGDDIALGPTEDAADRVLTFAVESLDMLRSVTSIFGESVEKAEAWIERLRIVGLDRQRQRQQQQQQQQDAYPLHLGASASTSPTLPQSGNLDNSTAAGTKRRRGRGGGGGTGDDGMATGADVGATTDGEDGIVRRKRGARGRELSSGGWAS
ncbi:hypothetical protein JCM21900_002392 [Sporobolomyces salmonicolor]